MKLRGVAKVINVAAFVNRNYRSTSVADVMSATEVLQIVFLAISYLILFPVKYTEKICVRLGRLEANFFAP